MLNWKKQVWLLWCCQLISIAAMEMSEPFWPLFLRQLSPDTANIIVWSAIIYGAPLLVSGLVAPYWGKLGDRYGHKRMVLRASLGLAITQGLLFFCTELWEVLALRLLQGALAGIITAVLCFANSITPTEKRSAVIGKLTSATAAGAILGPVIGGVLIQWLSFSALFATASMACLLIALVLAAGLKQPPLLASGEQKKQPRPDSVPQLNTQLIGLGLLVIFLLQTAKALPSSFFALYAESYLAITPFMTGLLFSSAGIGMMLSAPLWGSYFDKLQQASKPLILAFITAIAGLCYFLHLQTDWLLLLLVRFVWGLCLGAMLPMIQALMITFAEESRQGLLIGRAQRNIKIGNLAGVSSGALLLVWWDYQTGFTVAAAVYLLAASVLLMVWSLLNRSYEPVPVER